MYERSNEFSDDDDFGAVVVSPRATNPDIGTIGQSGMITTHSRPSGQIIISRGFDAKFKCILDALRRKELAGSYKVSLATAEVMKVVVSASRWKTTQSVIERVQEIGKIMINAAPLGEHLIWRGGMISVLVDALPTWLACAYDFDQINHFFFTELAIGNIVRRVLSIIREEYLACQNQPQDDSSQEEEKVAHVLDPHSSPALYKMLAHDRHEDYTQPCDILSI